MNGAEQHAEALRALSGIKYTQILKHMFTFKVRIPFQVLYGIFLNFLSSPLCKQVGIVMLSQNNR